VPATIHLGTSAFTAAGWEGSFYPAGMKPADYLTYYATKFDTVEVDSTFYRTPSAATVRGWYAKTPKDFIFALKVPQEITHEKVLHDCDAEFKAFLSAADLLGEKLGPVLFQFGYFNQKAFPSLDEFLARLLPFLTAAKGVQKQRCRAEDPGATFKPTATADPSSPSAKSAAGHRMTAGEG